MLPRSWQVQSAKMLMVPALGSWMEVQMRGQKNSSSSGHHLQPYIIGVYVVLYDCFVILCLAVFAACSARADGRC